MVVQHVHTDLMISSIEVKDFRSLNRSSQNKDGPLFAQDLKRLFEDQLLDDIYKNETNGK